MTDDVATNPLPPYLYKTEELIIPKDDPWANDCLGMKEHAQKLWEFLEPVKQPFVMTLSAPYGMGKTSFLKCWKQDLENKSVSTVMFNAWESDYCDDAFAAFVASVEKQLPKGKAGDARMAFLTGAKKLGGAFLKNAPVFAAKVAAKHIIGEGAAEILKNVELNEDDVVDFAESLAGDAFKAQQATQDAIAAFKVTFENIIETHCNGKLIVFIDELDRCRPNYSVEVLERIKHIFSVKGVFYILAVDRRQLHNSISGVYGSEIDAPQYLRKFIDWDYDLPAPSHAKYCHYLFQNVFSIDRKGIPIGGDSDYGRDSFLRIVILFSSMFEVSLRDLDKYFTYLNLVLNIQERDPAPIELALAAFFKCLVKADCDALINWVPSAKFTETPIQKYIFKLMKLYDGDENYRVDYISNVGDLIVLFSHANYDSTKVKVSISENFIEESLFKDSHVTNEWIVSVLSGSAFRTRPPSIVKGFKRLEKLNI